MTRLTLGAALLLGGASMMAAQAPAPRRAATAPAAASSRTFQPPEAFRKYCFECHGGTRHKGDISIERLIQLSAESSVGAHWEEQGRGDAGVGRDAAQG